MTKLKEYSKSDKPSAFLPPAPLPSPPPPSPSLSLSALPLEGYLAVGARAYERTLITVDVLLG